MSEKFDVSLVIPVFNESKTIADLIASIKAQTFQPDEVILVDGGSTDNTVEIINKLTGDSQYFRIIKAGRAMPGRGRNIGAEKADTEWIAFTDAGIKLDLNWLEYLVKKAEENPMATIIYGNYAPQINSFFDKCAAITYVPGVRQGLIRGKSIVSCLLKKKVWEKAGGFPDWRATEDLVFMEKAEAAGYQVGEVPEAMAWWELRPNLYSTFKKFDLYSKYNVWVGRQAYWHYGVARQYALMSVFVLLGIFHHWYWLLILPLWMAARVAKRIFIHRNQFGLKTLFNPAVFFMVMLITLVIDAATFSGWLKAIFQKPVVSS
jgi:glycosyltransferase involved in cell wall biosynthesis